MLPRPESKEIDRKARLQVPPVRIPVQPPEARVRNFDEVHLPWTAEMVSAEASRCLQCPAQPCVNACPLGNDIPVAMWLAEHGDLDGAADVFRRTNNFSDVCGRVCPQSEQCEGACPHINQGLPPVAIGRIEAHLADGRRRKGKRGGNKPPHTGRRVAVIGAGPAGLTVAELLGEKGHLVTVFDQWPDGGGVLRYGIPRFKLDHCLIRERLSHLRELGVEFLFNTRVGDDWGVDELLSDTFDAVFLGTGAGVPLEPAIPGANLKGIYGATPFLVRANVEQNLRPSELEDPPVVGRRVAVFGGGDTAMDCSRTALRLGSSEVTCYYRRTEAEMPGNPRDRVYAREEGVRLEWLSVPVSFEGDRAGFVRGVELVRMALGEPDASGRPRPVEVEGSRFHVPADTVVMALGYRPDASLGKGTVGLRTTGAGLVVTDPATGRTSRELVWAGGDNVLGPALVADAVAQGRAAAMDMHQRLAW